MNPNSHLFAIVFVVMVGVGVAVHKGHQLFGKIIYWLKKFDRYMYDLTSEYSGEDSDQEALGAMDTESAKWAEQERQKLEAAVLEDERLEMEQQLRAEQWIQYQKSRKALFGVGSHAWYVNTDGVERHIIIDHAPRRKNGKRSQVRGHFAARPNVRVSVSLYKLLTAKELKNPEKARPFQIAA